MFYVGQKVVCIEKLHGYYGDGVTEPGFGDVATIVNIYSADDDIHLELAEYPAPDSDAFYAGWLAECFRPIVERKTDISIFTALLTPERRKVDA